MTWRNFTDISRSIVQSCPTLWLHGLQSARLLCAWDSAGKNTEVGCHFLLQGIFLTQWLNPHLLHWQADSFTTEPSGEPFISIALSKRNRTKKRMNEKRKKRGRKEGKKEEKKNSVWFHLYKVWCRGILWWWSQNTGYLQCRGQISRKCRKQALGMLECFLSYLGQ